MDRTGIFFVCRLKDNARYEVIETLFENELSEKQAGVMKVEHIHLQYKEDKTQKTLCLRKVTYSTTEEGTIKNAQKVKIKFLTQYKFLFLMDKNRG